MDMLHNLIVIIFFFSLFMYVYKHENKTFTSSSFLILIYLGMAISSILYIELDDLQQTGYGTKFIGPALLFCVLNGIFFFPFLRFNEKKKQSIIIPNDNVLYIFSMGIIILSFLSILYFLPKVYVIFSLSDLSAARRLVVEDTNPFIQVGLLNTLASASSSLYAIAILLFFIYLKKGEHKILRILLLISSTSYILNVFAYVGRDGVIFWLFSFIYCYLLFKSHLDRKIRKRVNKIIAVILMCTVPALIAITVSRFEDRSLFGAFIDYYGQPYYHFSQYATLPNRMVYDEFGGANFPLFRTILGLPEVEHIVYDFGVDKSWVFGTYLKSFWISFGLFGLFFVACFTSMAVNKSLHPHRNKLYFHEILMLILYFQILSQGVFYFRQYSRGGNLYILIIVLLYFAFSFWDRRHPVAI